MDLSWLPRAVVPIGIFAVLALLRRFAPSPPPPSEHWTYSTRQWAEPLPYGVVPGFMCFLGICAAATYFFFQWANAAWAGTDGPGMLHVLAPRAYWCFFPLFGALAIPWPFTIWLLRRLGRDDEADEANSDSSAKVGANSYIAMKWLSLGLALPIGVATLLAIPIHLSLGEREARVGHYASFSEDVYPLEQATKATLVDTIGYRKGKAHHEIDLLIDFRDGRRLRANQVGDGGSSADQRVMDLLLANTHLTPQSVTRDAGPPQP